MPNFPAAGSVLAAEWGKLGSRAGLLGVCCAFLCLECSEWGGFLGCGINSLQVSGPPLIVWHGHGLLTGVAELTRTPNNSVIAGGLPLATGNTCGCLNSLGAEASV